MILWIIQLFLLSFVFIFVVHNVCIYLMNTLTITKKHDVIDKSNYRMLVDKLTNSETFSKLSPPIEDIDFTMKDELKQFVKSHLL